MTTERETILLRSLTETTWRFYLWAGMLLAAVAWGLYAYLHQLRNGLAVTGLRDQVSWGLYITNFVFFIGISHAGTLISAILRVTRTDWRRPITRMAEAITVFSLCIGAPMVIVDLGRPDRLLNLFRYGRLQSPILWDVLSVSTYLTGCVLYFYLPLIPDLGMLADHPDLPNWRKRLYRTFSLGWKGTQPQKYLLEKAISIMAVFIIPLAVSVHTVVSWIFAMTLRPGWDSSIFGPYFVVGAIFSGCASVILSMYILRRVFRLEDYLLPLHFRNLGLLLLTFALLYTYFNINEYLTVGYKFPGMHKTLLEELMFGEYALSFWGVQMMGVFCPIALMIAVLAFKRHQQFIIPGVAFASAAVVAGAWAKRYLIVIPTLSSPYLPTQGVPWEWSHYRPTWVEWSITLAAFAGFLLIYTLVSKLLPMVSIWETRDEEAADTEAPERWPAKWRPNPALGTALIVVFALFCGSLARAGETRAARKPKATVISLDWHAISPSKTPPASGEEHVMPTTTPRAYLMLDRVFGRVGPGISLHEEDRPLPSINATASLLEQGGAGLSFKVVDFSLKTSFGILALGSWPTLDDGKASVVIRDRRYGQYLLMASFRGDDEAQAARGEAMVDFGPRPPAALPEAGVLITPYLTAGIGLPFVLFYGTMWVVLVYAFGYLILWRMRRNG